MISRECAEPFFDSLIKGRYNLLFGSGVSLDSKNGLDKLLPSARELCGDLCLATGAPSGTSLSRVYSLLNEQQKEDLLTNRFKDCQPGPTLQRLPEYLWRRIFTFNIDDVLESLYEETANRKQQLVPLNFNAPFEPTPDRTELLAIHLHGWVRQPDAGYVFSVPEYVRVMSSLNPWMHLLSEILATEPFIIAGTSLNEVDLEYYLSYRSEKTPRRDRGPSLLIEPDPSVVTEADCKRYGLELFKGTFEDFLAWLRVEIPAPPDVGDLIIPDISSIFNIKPDARDLASFFSDFELVRSADLELPSIPTGFLYGRKPTWEEIDRHLDIERTDNKLLFEYIDSLIAKKDDGQHLIVVLDDAGAGKTTTTRRVVHDFALRGVPVLSACTTSRLDPDVSIRCLRQVSRKVIVLVDGIADHAEQVAQLIEDPQVNGKIILLATERGYRRDYLSVVFGESRFTYWRLRPSTKVEREQLIERYRKFGLVGAHTAMQRPENFADQISGDPMAVAICRIMNDFKPLRSIVTSLLDACNGNDRLLYVCVALSEHCIKAGIKYSILQSIAGPGRAISSLFERDTPLGLATNPLDDDYVIAINGVIAEQVLFQLARRGDAIVKEAFEAIAAALAPHVNRAAIKKRTPEARLAGRLFDCDKVLRPLLGESSENFLRAVQPQWEWNSRYWEQRALLVASDDIEVAVRYARQAVAIELHSFPLTTLGKVLLIEMEQFPEKVDVLFQEAVKHLINAIERESRYARVTIHPYVTLLNGTIKYLELGGKIDSRLKNNIYGYIHEARSRFREDHMINVVADRLEVLL